QTRPDWMTGKALRVVLQARLKKFEEARRGLEALVAEQAYPMPAASCWTFGKQFEGLPPLRDAVLRLYESAVEPTLAAAQAEFHSTPVQQLITIYQKSNRPEDVRRLLWKIAASPPRQVHNTDANYRAYQRLQHRNAIAQQLLQLGYPVDALRLYRENEKDAEA